MIYLIGYLISLVLLFLFNYSAHKKPTPRKKDDEE